MNRLYASFAVAALAAPLAWWWSGTGAGDAVRPEHAQQAAPAPAYQSALELQQRALSARRSDLFAPPANLAAPVKPGPVAPPEAPKAPPLPYKYDGSGEVQGKRFVYLAREGRSSAMVSIGDTIDGTYRVENVSRDHAVLRYLPLGIRQVLMYQPGAELPAELAEDPAAGRPLALQVEMPREVVLGQEFVVTFSLPGPSPLKATVEVGYDVEVLRLFGAKQRRGRETVVLAGAGARAAQLRFKVVADSPSSTEINLQANATDTSGKHVPVSTPSTYTISLVLAGGA